MSNHIDPAATRPIRIGPCRCPGDPPPHDVDTADIVRMFGYGERAEIRQATRLGGVEAGYMKAILLGVKRWNLVLPDGSARPIDATQIAQLDEATVERLMGADVRAEEGDERDSLLGEAFEVDELPLAFAASSPAGSQESGTRTQTTPSTSPPTST